MSVSLVLTTYLLQAAAPECGDAAVRQIQGDFNDNNYADAERAATACAARSRPIFYFYAAQAQERLRKWSRARTSLKNFLASGPSGERRSDAERMLADCEKKLAPKPAKPPPQPAQPDPPPTAPQSPTPDAPPPNPTPDDKAASDITPDVDDDIKPEATTIEKLDEPPRRDRSRQRLWLGLGVSAGASAIAAIATGISGHLETEDADETNGQLLDKYTLPSDYDPAACTPEQCINALALESEYSARTYYEQLANGLKRESAGVALGTASLGLLLGAVPEVARDPRQRRIGLAVTIALGAATLAGGAVLTSAFAGDVSDNLRGYDVDTNPDGWRGGPELDAARRNMLLSAALTGLGAGLVVGGGTAAIVRWRAGPRDETRASLRVAPTFGGLMLRGRF